MRSSTWLSVLVMLVGLGIGRQAHAGAKMDWSEYIEAPGYKVPLQMTTVTPRPAKASAAPKKASRTVAKKQTKSKKAKRSARSKGRR